MKQKYTNYFLSLASCGVLAACQPTANLPTLEENTPPATPPSTTPLASATPTTDNNEASPPQPPVAASPTALPPAESSNVQVARLSIATPQRYLDGEGKQAQLQVIAQDTDGNNIPLTRLQLNFTSSRPQDISVDANGRVTAHNDFGYSYIQVSVQNQTAQTLISVNNSALGGSRSNSSASSPRITQYPSGQINIGDTLTLEGLYLDKVTSLTIDGLNVPLTTQSSRQLQFRVPAEARMGKLVITSSSGLTQEQNLTLNNKVWFVDASASGENTGLSWTNAFNDLQSALAVAEANDEIWLAEGRYTPSQTGDRTQYFMVPSAVKLYGGFSGSESFSEQRDRVNHKALLSGDLDNNDIYGSMPFSNPNDNSLNILRHGNNAVIEGVIIEGGFANQTDDLPNPQGAGIFSGSNNLTLRYAELRNLYSVNQAGAWQMNGGTSTLENVSFLRTTATGSGGGAFYISTGQLNLENVSFDTCVANGGGGGAIYNNGGTLNLSNVTFTNLQANGGGGAGIYSTNGQITLNQGSFSNSQATGAGGSGIYANNTPIALTQVQLENNTHSLGVINVNGSGTFTGDQLTFSSNTASAPGGGIYASSPLVLRNSEFTNTQSNSVGGCVYTSNASTTIENTTFHQCASTGAPGGALYISSGVTILDQLTFTENTSASTGGALNVSGTSLQLSNSRFTQNNAANPGGGAYITTNSTTLSRLTFQENSSQNNGGGLYLSTSNANLSDLFFVQNSSVDPGGALYLNSENTIPVKNSVFANNSATNFGGGIYKAGAGELQLQHTTFSENTSTSGDAIYNSSGNLVIRNSIIWDAQGTPIFMNAGTLTGLYSILKDLGSYTLEAGSLSNLASDPLFFNSADLEGTDNVLGTADDGLAPAIGSPAINLDTSNGAPVVAQDITQRNRDTQPDAGAYEK